MRIFYILILNIALTAHLAYAHKTLFCHGIISDKNQLDLYPAELLPSSSSFNFEDAQIPEGHNLNHTIFKICDSFGKRVNRNCMHMGYGNDISTLTSNIDPKKETILYGLSRGGSTIINCLAQENPSNITGVILEATPCDVVSAVESIQHATGIPFAPHRTLQEMFFKIAFPSYKLNTTPTINRIKNIQNKNLPILIIHSQDDRRVHISSSWKLYIELKNLGFTKVYFSELTTGKHGFYIQGECKEKMSHDIQAFIEGITSSNFTSMPTSLSPDTQQVQKTLNEYNQTIATQYTIKKIRNSIIAFAGAALYFYARSSK